MLKHLAMAAFLAVASLCPNTYTVAQTAKAQTKNPRIQVAILLDVSGSMDGLIEQAKSQLWKMVNQLATTKKDGKAPDIELALYEYGNSSLPAEGGYMRQITPFTRDLDLVSSELFKLSTNGGDEFCGWAIQDAVDKLEWSKSNDDLKIVVIAGNEPFTQGKIDYKDSCKKSISNGIVVNTIFCGNCDEGVQTNWKDGADRADGKYMCINQNAVVQHISSPFDQEIVDLNTKLNGTYIAFGNEGRKRLEMQKNEDSNASTFGASNMAERAVSKSGRAYKNSSWDAVDAYKDKGEAALNDEDELPEEMKKMNEKERKAYIEKKAAERAEIQQKIQETNKKREAYIAEERKKQSASAADNTLDAVMNKAVREQANAKKFQFE